MATWTKMKINGDVRFSANQLRTHVTASTLQHSHTLPVKELRLKVQDRDIHPVLRKIYQDMLNYVESLK